MAQGQATTNFTDAGSAGVDLGVKYVTKDYLMTFYPNLVNQMKAPALWTWGKNNFGQLGNGTTVNTSSPVQITAGGTTWRSVSCGYNFTAAVKTDGTLWTWGQNNFGQLGNVSTTDTSSPSTVSGGGTTWSSVSAGSQHTAAIKTDGTLWTWGRGWRGQLGNGTMVDRSSPGTVSGGGTTWMQVGSGSNITAAIKSDGTLWTWGINSLGQLGNGSTIADTSGQSSPGTVAGGGTTWSQLSCSLSFIGAIKTDGTLWTWGYNNKGQLGNGSMVNRSSPGTTVNGGTTWASVSCGYLSIAAIKTDGTLWTVGLNDKGQLGNGSTIDYATGGQSSFATVAGGGTTWKSVSCSFTLSAIKTDGTLWTCGDNAYGQLGNGTTVNRSSPGTVSGGGTNWKLVTCSSVSTFAIAEAQGY